MTKSEVFGEACDFFRKNSSSIELLRDGKLEKVLFYLPTYSNFLKSNLQNEYEIQVDRSSTKTKVLDLQLSSKNLISKAKQEHRIHIIVKKSKVLNFIFSKPQLWPAISFYTLMLTVILIMFSFRYDSFDKKTDRPQILGYLYDFQMARLQLLSEIIFFMLGLIMMYCHLVRIICDMIRIVPLYFNIGDEEEESLLDSYPE